MERVILVKGDSTKWYNQAIFIVNQNMPATKMPVDFVAEAEKIIYNHMASQRKHLAKAAAPGAYTSAQKVLSAPSNYNAPATRTGTAKKHSKFDFMLNLVMILACVAIIAVFVYGMMA
jgi:predicted metal-dependent phosphoesterase TrpH